MHCYSGVKNGLQVILLDRGLGLRLVTCCGEKRTSRMDTALFGLDEDIG